MKHVYKGHNIYSVDPESHSPGRYALILAGGEGLRLKALTRMIVGDGRPKQFCPILNDETLLDVTRKRVALKIRPENTFYSLNQNQEQFYVSLLEDVSANQMVVQPQNRGTAPAILYSLLRIANKAPEAVVGVFPSDHYFSDDDAFMKHVELAYGVAEANSDSIVLLGIEAESAETSYGWIEPVESFFGKLPKSVSGVKCFWEKPDRGSAEHLLADGCLWNSFVMIGTAGSFLDLFRRNMPGLFKTFQSIGPKIGCPTEERAIRSIYSRIHESNFSSEVLEKVADELFVLRVAEIVWCDWGEPQRVLGTLRRLGVRKEWMAYAS